MNFQFGIRGGEKLFIIYYKFKKIATIAVAAITKRKCVICKEQLGVLKCDDGDWICESCAQVMGEITPD